MDSKFTPGPWKVDARTGMPLAYYGLCVSASHYSKPGVEDGRDGVCDQIKGPHAEANARLIAAAPDLYAELAAVKEWMEDCLIDRQQKGTPSRVRYDAICAALARVDQP